MLSTAALHKNTDSKTDDGEDDQPRAILNLLPLLKKNINHR
ncbi:hypothetical protein OAK05_03580 [Gammaproteobacteria bacterium]|nr:hypothetical protein [Gammaproteobacteria bacterium]